MSHLKESLILGFSQDTIAVSGTRPYELIFPLVTPISFTTSSVAASQGWFTGTAATLVWTIRKEINTPGSIGTINLSSGGVVTFTISPITLDVGEVITIVPPASLSGASGSLGVSLIGER